MRLYSSIGVADIWTCAGTCTKYPYNQSTLLIPDFFFLLLVTLWLYYLAVTAKDNLTRPNINWTATKQYRFIWIGARQTKDIQ